MSQPAVRGSDAGRSDSSCLFCVSESAVTPTGLNNEELKSEFKPVSRLAQRV